MTFREALEIVDKAKRAVHLPEADTRLVKLSKERIGVQYHNTYIVRIQKDGNYVLAASKRDEATLFRLNFYSPAKIIIGSNSEWFMQDGLRFTDYIVIDSDGKPIRS